MEGMDALGSNVIELWTPLLKEYAAIKEVLKNSLNESKAGSGITLN